MKSKANIPFLCLLGLALLLWPGQSLQAATTLGLAPAAYSLDAAQEAHLAKLQTHLAAKVGQPVAIRMLASEKVLQDWLLRFREVDAALLTQSYYRQQPAGSLVPLVDLFTVRDGDAPSLVLVVAPGLDQQKANAWSEAFLNLPADSATGSALADAGIKTVARSGMRRAGTAPVAAVAPVPAVPVVATPVPKPVVVAEAPETPAAVVVQPLPEPVAVVAQSLSIPPTKTVSEQPLRIAPLLVASPAPILSAPLQEAAPGEVKRLDLAELVRLVVQQNQRIQMQRAQFAIKQVEEEKTHAIFEPSFVASFQLEDSTLRNTAEESTNRLFDSIYSKRNWDYSAAVQGLAPTGARYKLSYTLRDLSNSVGDQLYGQDEHQMSLGVSLRQPLLKNAGVGITRSGIDAAGFESRAAYHDYRRDMMKTVGEAAQIYWSYYQAQEKLKLRQESVDIAEKILNDNRERLRTGKMAETEVLEASAGVAARQSLLSEAAYELRDTESHLRRVLAISSVAQGSPVEVNETPVASAPALDRAVILQKSFEYRPDYLAALERLNQADVKIAYARNQRWPELDLIASYSLNGLDFSRGGAWGQIEDTNYAAWAVGMEFRLPLQGGIESRSELKKQELEKKRQLWALKDIEVSLANGVDTALHKVTSAAQQLDYANSSLALRKQLLEAEKARLQAGKSHSRQVLEKEDSYRIAFEEALESRVRLQTALIELQQADGSILLNNGVEILGREL